MRHHPRGMSNVDQLIYVAVGALALTGLATISQASEAVVNADQRIETAVPPAASAPPPPGLEEGRPQPDEQPVNPQECRDVQRQIKDQLRELTRFEKMLRKQGLTTDLELVGPLRAKINQFAANIKRECIREHLQDFYDEQPWDEINKFRCKAELPQQFTQIERELKRLDRQATPKRMQFTGLDQERYKVNLGKVKQAFAEAKAAVGQGDCESANDAMQTFWEEGMHPGEIMSVVNRLHELGKQLKRVKDTEIRSQIQEVIQPIIDAANEGDFREANQTLNEVGNELERLIFQVMQKRGSQRSFDERIDRLEQLIERKLEGGGSGSEARQPTAVEQPASPAAVPAG